AVAAAASTLAGVAAAAAAGDGFGTVTTTGASGFVVLLLVVLALLLLLNTARCPLVSLPPLHVAVGVESGLPADSTVADELDRRLYRDLLRCIAVFYLLLGVTCAVAAATSTGTSGLAIQLFIVQALLACTMSAFAFLLRASIPLRALRRKSVGGLVPSPEPVTGWFSRLTFSWFDPVMASGFMRDLNLSDLWDLADGEQVDRNMDTYFQVHQERPKASLMEVLFVLCRRPLVKQVSLVLLSTALFFAGPFFLNRILLYLSQTDGPDALPPWTPYAYVVGLVAAIVVRFILEAQISLLGQKINIRTGNVLSGLVYQKSLRKSVDVDVSNTEAGASVGKIVSLMSVDTQMVGYWSGSMYMPFTTLVNVILCVAALCYVLGWAAISGVVVMVLLLVSGFPLANSLRKRFAKLKKIRDRRVNATNELIQGIKIVKLFAWEAEFEKKIDNLREDELHNLFVATLMANMTRVLWFSAPILTTLVTLATYTVVAGKELDAAVAFTALALFNMLRGPMQAFPDTMVALLDTWVSFQRIENFLKEEEMEEFTNNDGNLVSGFNPNIVLGFEHASFNWPTKRVAHEPSRPSVYSSLLSRLPLVGKLRSTAASTVPRAVPVSPEAVANAFRLSDVDIQFTPRRLTAVVGATGSGKSALLQALLGEMRRTQGRRSCPSDDYRRERLAAASAAAFARSPGVAYVSQIAWLANATIRENILFGLPYDEQRYTRVVEACALVRDLEVLEGGDQTEVGEKGINLSGGQKQRLALARAAYSNSPWIVMDDPLSAVDAPTARHIYENCILGLLAGRTRILVTNALNLVLPQADVVVVVDSGCITNIGTPEHVLGVLSDSETRSSFEDSLIQAKDLILCDRQRYAEEKINASEDPFDIKVDELPHLTEEANSGLTAADRARKAKAKLVEDESMAKGNVKFHVYWLYLSAMGGVPFFVVLVFGYALNIGLTTYLDVIVSQWSRSYRGSGLEGLLRAGVNPVAIAEFFTSVRGIYYAVDTETEDDPTRKYLSLYAIAGACTILAIICRLLILLSGKIRAGRKMHAGMLKRVLWAPLRFFETTPMGRIVNRFSKDLQAVDTRVSVATGNTIFQILTLIIVLGTICSVIPALFLVIVPLIYVYAKVGLYYIKTSRSIKRISSVVRSPIFSHFSETLNGISVIRAFHQSRRFQQHMERLIEDSNRAEYFLFISGVWLSVRIQALGSVVVLFTAFLILLAGLGPHLAGLCLNFTLNISDSLIAVVRLQSMLEMSMNAIERCDEYLKLDQEAPAVVPAHRPPPNWPHTGVVSIRALELRYAPELPLVLRGVSAEIGAREKVGIVGRTGAGKSSLSMAFFRIVEPSAGTIVVDGVDLRTIGLRDLRAALSVIPQDPVLFAGDVRANLDPFGACSDADLSSALRRAHLAARPALLDRDDASTVVSIESAGDATSTTASRPPGDFSVALDTPVAEGGANFSVGQRQLLCLARALARRSRLVVLDEATASVDSETDARIQDTIRSELGDATVLTIAHRLKTIADYDRVLVLDHGAIIENGSPLSLLEGSPHGAFHRMCEESGEFTELLAIARDADRARQKGVRD
ncbi:hypothetical protein HK405_000253, partial [Cladochytrium tenue]